MITVAHGSDTSSSRNFYINERNNSKSYILIDKVDYDQIYQSLEGDSLFEGNKSVFVENFFSNIKSNSNEFKKIVELINTKKEKNIFFWEGKELTKIQQLVFKNSLVKTFNFPSNLFAFLDSLKPGNNRSIILLKELESSMETELIFYMMVRQFRLLLSVFDSKNLVDEAKRLQPWQKSKLLTQAELFGKDKLIERYRKLYKIDYQTKFGLTPFNLSASIDIFLANL